MWPRSRARLKTLRAAGLLPVARIEAQSAECGMRNASEALARASPIPRSTLRAPHSKPWPQPKSPATGPLSIFRQALKPYLICLALCLPACAGASGLAWHWANPLPHGNNVVALGYYNGLTIEAADLGQLYTSDDLLAPLWTPCPTGTTNSLQAIAVYGNRVVVTGANGTVLYSDDGVDYVYINLATPDWLVGVAASTNLVIAVGDEAAIYTSSDGAGWARQKTPPNVGDNWLTGAAYGAGLFVAVGEGGYIATSPNGTNWTQRTVSGTSFANNLNSVAWIETPDSANGPSPRPVFSGGQ